ncbi:Protein kinase C signaling pathway involved MAPKK protein [Paramarasmius palmivorus]|uniref:mitogen-activated protein kinase kinase n=1 Tax=Paramarasmius palmivorus TaxID=297713 RepID=A0AAW0DPP7_9AGAR
MMATPSRPLGPRKPPGSHLSRSASPLPPLHVPEPVNTTQPLNIRKSKPDGHQLSPPTLSIPTPGRRTPNIKLQIPAGNLGPENYYGGGPQQELPANSTNNPPDDGPVTIKPSTPNLHTEMPPHTQIPPDPVEKIRKMIDQVGIDDDAIPDLATTAWSNDLLEEVARLGEGAGGAVHKVKDKRTGRILARKTITTREAPTHQLLRELSVMSTTDHPNITKFYGAFMSPSSSEVMIIMEYCEGGSLEAIGKRIKERGAVVGEKIAGRIAEGVLQGLAYLHARRTIHRDIKPSNILLSREGVVKICDFGVSGELVGSYAGTFTGTSLYMAPERILGNEYTIRSDVWSLGISLLELVQNRFPFPNDLPPIELMMYITSGEPPRLEDEGEVKWSDDMKDFIKQALMGDAASRPIPKDMLKHPWIGGVMKQEVHMARWIRQVWDWKKTRPRDDASTSRPSTGNSTTSSRPQSSHRADSSSSEESPPRSHP